MYLIILFQFPITALREIRILQLLKHDNVVNLLEICQTRGNYNLNKHVMLQFIILIFVFFLQPLNLIVIVQHFIWCLNSVNMT